MKCDGERKRHKGGLKMKIKEQHKKIEKVE